jgi:hypothetical protein
MRLTPPTFVFDREPEHQQRARRRLAPVALGAAAGYVALDSLLTPLLGGVWGVLVALLLAATPLGATWWASERDVRGWRAWRTGLLLAVLGVLLYAWLFIGSVA